MHGADDRHRVPPGDPIHLADHAPDDTGEMRKSEAKKELAELRDEIDTLQRLLYATQRHALLVILQGMDTSGKDGTIRKVLGGVNPQGCHVTSFKVPTAEEASHDFLWRIHRAVPGRGMIGVFNRSHYEDVLVVRVEGLAPEEEWCRRYDAINAFERNLVESGVHIVKCFLHISKEEQRERLLNRLEDPTDQWKFSVGDLAPRARWDAYMAAYEDAVNRCSTEWAPWYVVPADKKWYRNLLVARLVARTLRGLAMEWPPLEAEAVGISIE